MNELQRFVEKVTCDTDGSGDFRFVLLRWSRAEPYWCVFACEHKENTANTSRIESAIGIGGHYCIGAGERLQDVLSTLVRSGWKVEIHPYFFNS